jgi:hypothetical protein
MRSITFKVSMLVALLFFAASPVSAGDYTLTPDGSYVGGDDYTLTPDGSYVGGYDE